MTSTNQSWSVREIVRHEQGARESQQDAVFAGDILFAIADGFGSGDTAARAAVDIKVSDVCAGDRYILTSDGVHSFVDAGELASLMLLDADLETVASRIAKAVEGAGAPDNFSLVLIEVA